MTCQRCHNPAIHEIETATRERIPSCGVCCNLIVRQAQRGGRVVHIWPAKRSADGPLIGGLLGKQTRGER